MAINLNNLILKVSSRISDHVDGDTVLLIEQYVPSAINRVTKQLARSKAPGHEMLLVPQNEVGVSAVTNEYSGESGYGIVKFDISGLTNKLVLDGNFHDLSSTISSTEYKIHPVNSLSALSLSGTHAKLCYFIDYPTVYIGHPDATTPTTVSVTHYSYLPLASFPDQLEEYLVDDLVALMQGEAQKQQTERSMGDV